MRALGLALLFVSGCYDFASLGNHHDASVVAPSSDLAPDDSCMRPSDCADGHNCSGGHCVFGILGANRQFGQLLGEALRHLFLHHYLRAKHAGLAEIDGAQGISKGGSNSPDFLG